MYRTDTKNILFMESLAENMHILWQIGLITDQLNDNTAKVMKEGGGRLLTIHDRDLHSYHDKS